MRHLNQEKFDLKKTLKPYARQWKWFVLSCFVFIVLAFFKLRYSTPEYNANAKIMLTMEDASSTPAGALLQDLGKGNVTARKALEDEIEILQSRKLMKGVIEKLDLNIQYSLTGRLHDTHFFPNSKAPVSVSFIESDSIINQSQFSFDLAVTSNTTFNFIYAPYNGSEEIVKKSSFGNSISTPIGDIVITPNTENIISLKEKLVHVNILPVENLAAAFQFKIGITAADEFSKVINLSLNDYSIVRAKAVLNTLIDEYNRVGIEEKTLVATNTADFIDKRINLISSDLSAVDDEVEQFKTGNKLTDITSEADIYIRTNSETEQQLAASRTELNMVNYMRAQIDDNVSERIPFNVGLSNASINNMAVRYNQLLDDRERLLKSSNEKNPIIVNLDQEINNLKAGLHQALDNSAETVQLRIRSLQNQSARLSSKIFSVPGQVRKSRDIEREQGIKESLYLFLLQKREEATISLRSSAANAKIIDMAHSSGIPVSPKVKIVYLAAIIFGLCIPFGFIYVNSLLDTKIHNREDIEGALKNLHILGEIPKLASKEVKLIKRNDRSVLSESFRIIRTNFRHISRSHAEAKKYKNIIFVTSTINGEGKSFTSVNTALTISNTGKKVLLIGADLRNPQILSSLKSTIKKEKFSKIGLSEYLSDNTYQLKDAITSHSINDLQLDILPSGSIPPNPAELLLSDKIKELFDTVSEEYDYVVVDTAPSMMVTDTLLISEYAAYTMYVIRADYTEKPLLNFAKELHADKKLNNMMVVVNDVKQSNFGYGGKYGYYENTGKRTFFGRLKKYMS
ncbi:GumC family protein [Algibacter mikhailovii]|uniref:non-specific protein-tyrosine kinase n=1 Tax=Algibacter mikhailovii TaxID=425498 RepID=A0A918QTW6_9FLAO|nr:tyrosine-protein kinase [Algibacter mikhailovii]GGZ70263.1 tyrosine protein kinase [Algibacter mikhailovii]